MIFLAAWSLFALGWIYNVFYISKDLKLMFGRSPRWYQSILFENKVSWMFICPSVLGLAVYPNVLPGLNSFSPYVEYPIIHLMTWTFMLAFPLLWAFICTMYHACCGKGFARAWQAVEPWGPADASLRLKLLSKENEAKNGRGITYKTATHGYEAEFYRKPTARSSVGNRNYYDMVYS